MTRPRNLPESFYEEDFERLAKKETNAKTKIRFLTFHYLQQGHTYASAAQLFLITLNSVQKWIARYKKDRVEGLKNKTIPGRPGYSAHRDPNKIIDKIIAMQADKKGGRVRLKDIQSMLSKDFDIHYQDINGVHYLVTKLGLSWISARSKHPKQDKATQELYKKTSNKRQ